MPTTAIIWGVIAKIANKMADLSPLFNSLYTGCNSCCSVGWGNSDGTGCGACHRANGTGFNFIR